MKTCSKCGKEKDLSSFSRDNAKLSGYRSACKECINTEKRNKNALKIKVVEEKSEIERGIEETPQEVLPPIDIFYGGQILNGKSKIEVKHNPFTILSELIDKHHAFVNVSVNRNGKARLQIFSNPAISYKADSLDSLLEIVYNSECL